MESGDLMRSMANLCTAVLAPTPSQLGITWRRFLIMFSQLGTTRPLISNPPRPSLREPDDCRDKGPATGLRMLFSPNVLLFGAASTAIRYNFLPRFLSAVMN